MLARLLRRHGLDWNRKDDKKVVARRERDRPRRPRIESLETRWLLSGNKSTDVYPMGEVHLPAVAAAVVAPLLHAQPRSGPRAVKVARSRPVPTTQPLSQTVGSGDVVTFTAAATGNPRPSVHWQVSVNHRARGKTSRAPPRRLWLSSRHSPMVGKNTGRSSAIRGAVRDEPGCCVDRPSPTCRRRSRRSRRPNRSRRGLRPFPGRGRWLPAAYGASGR